MSRYLRLDPRLRERFPDLNAEIIHFRGVQVERQDQRLEEYKDMVALRLKERWNLDQLREDPVFRAYRDFFWRLGIDPTKNRPAAEALIRRVLRDSPIPRINTWVDAYNLVSMETAIPIASFDADLLGGELLMREATTGEEFTGIGMEKPVTLTGGEAVIEDGDRLVAIYPYRDADHSKVTFKTVNVLMLMCGSPGITLDTLSQASSVARDVLPRFCGGRAE
ncbi:MAG TPA: phenylalanine--tRNA ligase beta subunit-related protein [Candidatus Desulfaltia sp.]|nr:phenylalanine--tRNA ligase beta subunit-related protein [Candidatus Desulfaltia sp.]